MRKSAQTQFEPRERTPSRCGGLRALAALGLALFLGACGQAAPPVPGRIILFSMDTVRADQVGAYGDAHTTPNLDRIAEEGVWFRNFYAASSYTIPSHMSVFTGLDPAEHGVATKMARLAPEVPTLAERLQAAGWRTKAFHEGGYVAARFGFDRGFDSYDEYERLEVVGDALPEVLDWIEGARSERYFLFLHTYCAHYPYGGMARYRAEHPERRLPTRKRLQRLLDRTKRNREPLSQAEQSEIALYNYFVDRDADRLSAALAYNQLGPGFPSSSHFELDRSEMLRSYDERIGLIDAALGQLRSKLEELGQWEDTLLVVFADHGEAFFEHGLERHDFVPFNEVLKVPLVVSYPRLTAGRSSHVVEGLAWHLDLAPTLLQLAGVPASSGNPEAHDLARVLQGSRSIDPNRVLFPGVLRPAFRPQLPLARVAIQGTLKRIPGRAFFGDEGGFLFDVDADPGEADNLRDERRAAFDRLAALSDAYEARLHPTTPVHQETGERLSGDPVEDSGVGLSAEARRKLEDLGYVGGEE